jgi:hypothetical protein
VLDEPPALDPAPVDELDVVGRGRHLVGAGTEEVPTLGLTESLALRSHVVRELVDHPARVHTDQFDVVRPEARLLTQFAPRGVVRRLADIDTALRELPGARDVAAFERQHLVAGIRHHGDHSGSEVRARHG